MIIQALPEQAIRTPLHTAFTLDFTALFPEGTLAYGFSLQSIWNEENNDAGWETFGAVENGLVTVQPTETWVANPPVGATPDTPIGVLIVYAENADPVTIELLPPIDPLDLEAAWKGTSGANTHVFEGTTGADGAPVVLDSSGGSDRVVVQGAAAIVLGRSGNDTLVGWDGNDALYGGGGADSLVGAAGADRLFGMNGDDRLFGGVGRDLVSGGAGNDLLVGGEGDDTIVAGGGNDTLRGEMGDDRFILASLNTPLPERPLETVVAYGGEGDDTFESEQGKETVGRFSQYAIAGNDIGQVELYGGAGGDRFYANQVTGGAIYGGADDDYLSGWVTEESDGRLDLYGGAGADNIYGGRQAYLYGGDGDDYIGASHTGYVSAGNGADTLYGGFTYDLTSTVGLEAYGGEGADDLSGGNLYDTIHGGIGDDTIKGNSGQDRLFGGDGNDTLDGGNDADWLSGGAGDDSLEANDGSGNYSQEDIANGLANLSDTVFGGSGNDYIFADRAGHSLYGGSGNDVIDVKSWNSMSTVETTADGGLGDDTLIGNGQIRATGGEGNDVFVVELGDYDRTTVITDFVRGEDKLGIISQNGGFSNYIFAQPGEGTAGLGGNNGPSVSWISVFGNTFVYVDVDTDGLSDTTYLLEGVGDLSMDDFDMRTFASTDE
jgi:Ca2+-binding RTX toxin-like protein